MAITYVDTYTIIAFMFESVGPYALYHYGGSHVSDIYAIVSVCHNVTNDVNYA